MLRPISYDIVQQVEGSRIGPLEIIQPQQERSLFSQRLEEASHRLEKMRTRFGLP
jgi:hypothetical protein